MPQYQIIDARNKCKYIVSKNLTIIPISPSGSIYKLKIIKNMDKKLLGVKEMIKNLEELYKISKKKIAVKPIGLYYDTKTKSKAKIIAIMTIDYDVVPTKEELIDNDWINKQGYVLEHQQLYDKIDEEIQKGKENYIVDDRIKEVNFRKYYNESYELFRLEFSEYINLKENKHISKKIYKILNDEKIKKKEKRKILKGMIYKLVDTNLYSLYKKLFPNNQEKTRSIKQNKFIHILDKDLDVTDYVIDNNRSVCGQHKNKESCFANDHCSWGRDGCKLALTKNMIINFVNKISVELADNGIKASELLMKGDYFVSDIVDYSVYKERKGQKIIQSTNYMMNNVLESLFGKGNIPIIGKKRIYLGKEVDYHQLNIENPIKNIGDLYIQKIIENNLSVFRAYANSYYWLKQTYYDLEGHNLGYYSILQTNLANYFKSVVLDWLVNKKNLETIKKEIIDYMEPGGDNIYEFIFRLGGNITTITNCIVELYVLNKIYKMPIYVYDDNHIVIYLFDDGVVYDMYRDGKDEYKKKKYEKYRNVEFVKKSINLKFTIVDSTNVPTMIESIYYA